MPPFSTELQKLQCQMQVPPTPGGQVKIIELFYDLKGLKINIKISSELPTFLLAGDEGSEAKNLI